MFLGATMRPTSGNSRRTISAVPSSEALSITRTVIPPLGGLSRSEPRQSRSSSSQRYEMITASSGGRPSTTESLLAAQTAPWAHRDHGYASTEDSLVLQHQSEEALGPLLCG